MLRALFSQNIISALLMGSLARQNSARFQSPCREYSLSNTALLLRVPFLKFSVQFLSNLAVSLTSAKVSSAASIDLPKIPLACLKSSSTFSTFQLGMACLAFWMGFLCHQQARPRLLYTQDLTLPWGYISRHLEYRILASSWLPASRYALPRLKLNSLMCAIGMSYFSFASNALHSLVAFSRSQVSMCLNSTSQSSQRMAGLMPTALLCFTTAYSLSSASFICPIRRWLLAMRRRICEQCSSSYSLVLLISQRLWAKATLAQPSRFSRDRLMPVWQCLKNFFSDRLTRFFLSVWPRLRLSTNRNIINLIIIPASLQ